MYTLSLLQQVDLTHHTISLKVGESRQKHTQRGRVIEFKITHQTVTPYTLLKTPNNFTPSYTPKSYFTVHSIPFNSLLPNKRGVFIDRKSVV